MASVLCCFVCMRESALHIGGTILPAVTAPGVIDQMCGAVAGTASVTRWCTWGCHVSSQPLSPGQYRRPRCNPSRSSDPRRSAQQCPAPTWKLVTLLTGGDGCLWSRPDSYSFSLPSIITHGSFCLQLPPPSPLHCSYRLFTLRTRFDENIRVVKYCVHK